MNLAWGMGREGEGINALFSFFFCIRWSLIISSHANHHFYLRNNTLNAEHRASSIENLSQIIIYSRLIKLKRVCRCKFKISKQIIRLCLIFPKALRFFILQRKFSKNDLLTLKALNQVLRFILNQVFTKDNCFAPTLTKIQK